MAEACLIRAASTGPIVHSSAGTTGPAAERPWRIHHYTSWPQARMTWGCSLANTWETARDRPRTSRPWAGRADLWERHRPLGRQEHDRNKKLTVRLGRRWPDP